TGPVQTVTSLLAVKFDCQICCWPVTITSMKCITMFLVLSMVVMMAQPAEGFWGLIVQRLKHGVHFAHKILNGKDVEQLAEQLAEQQQLDKRDFED
ncbi:Dicentracin, partial [Oryzias melastigma]